MRYILDLATGGELYVDTSYVSAVEVVDIVNVQKVKDQTLSRFGIEGEERTTNERKGMLVHVDGEKYTCEYDDEFLETWMDDEEGRIS
jgi:hypothetical protein